jgi:hypothetical protein
MFLVVVACCTWTADAPGEPPCENEALRAEQGSTAVPGCRAYELVTPASKDSGEPKAVVAGLRESSLYATGEGMYTSETGDRMAWTSEYPLPGSNWAGLDYLSTRGANGWSTENVIPPQSVSNGTDCPGLVAIAAYSIDLSTSVLADGFAQLGSFKGEALECGHDEPPLVAGEPEGFQNLFLRDNGPGSYQLVNVTPSNAPAPHPAPFDSQYFPAAFLAGSNSLSLVVFEEELPLVPGAPAGDDLYSWSRSDGMVSLVSVLPDGTPVGGRLAGSTRNTERDESTQEFVPFNIAGSRHAVSGDGSRIFFQADGNLYVRENGTSTTQLDLTQRGAGSSGGGTFTVASEDGSRVFFTDENQLTADSKAEAGKPDLYEYDLGKPLGERLTDISKTGSAEPADVLGIAGASNDASYLYYVADGVLSSGAPSGTPASGPVDGQPNLYVLHGGATSFIATLDPNNDYCDWASTRCVSHPLFGGSTARVSSNGTFVGFESDQSLTGYDNVGPTCVPGEAGGTVGTVGKYTPGPCEEIFLYQAEINRLECASCDPSGGQPVWPGTIRFPGQASQDQEMRDSHPQRNVSDSGEVFFESKDALVPAATNGRLNVYVYEDGQSRLLSSGTSETDSYFLEASPDGGNVFFATSQALLPGQDTDSAFDIYDARAGGGFPEPIPPPAPCEEGASCRGALGLAPTFQAPGSAIFIGPGNMQASTAKPSTPKKLTAKQQLARELKECKRKPKRVRCRALARKRYASKQARKSTSGRAAR